MSNRRLNILCVIMWSRYNIVGVFKSPGEKWMGIYSWVEESKTVFYESGEFECVCERVIPNQMNHCPAWKLRLIKLYSSSLSHTCGCILLVWPKLTMPTVNSFFLSSLQPVFFCFSVQHNEPLNSDFCPFLQRLAPRLVPLWGGNGWSKGGSEKIKRYEGQLY